MEDRASIDEFCESGGLKVITWGERNGAMHLSDWLIEKD